jgi:hypothetical protein
MNTDCAFRSASLSSSQHEKPSRPNDGSILNTGRNTPSMSNTVKEEDEHSANGAHAGSSSIPMQRIPHKQ